MSDKNTTENNDILMKLLQKENETLRKALNEKNKDETLNSLLILLEVQRERLDNLEDGNIFVIF